MQVLCPVQLLITNIFLVLLVTVSELFHIVQISWVWWALESVSTITESHTAELSSGVVVWPGHSWHYSSISWSLLSHSSPCHSTHWASLHCISLVTIMLSTTLSPPLWSHSTLLCCVSTLPAIFMDIIFPSWKTSLNIIFSSEDCGTEITISNEGGVVSIVWTSLSVRTVQWQHRSCSTNQSESAPANVNCYFTMMFVKLLGPT